MIIQKITSGFVVQKYDTVSQRFISQEFVAGDECDYESDGETVDPSLLEVDGREVYLPYEMVQPS